MGIKLYFNDACASSRAILLVSKAVAVELELIEVENTETEPISNVLTNPDNDTSTVPSLVDGELRLWETHAICAYLVEKYGTHEELLPKDAQERALVNQYLHFNSSVLLFKLSKLLFPILQEGECEIPASKLRGIHEVYSFLDRHLKNRDYLTNSFTIADLCCVASISTFTTILPIASDTYENLSRWYTQLKTLPYYKEANEIGLNKLDATLEIKLRRILK